MADFRLDCKGQQCPKPIIQIARRMAQMTPGQSLRVEATDAAFAPDLRAWLDLKREMLVELNTTGPVAVAVLVKGQGS